MKTRTHDQHSPSTRRWVAAGAAVIAVLTLTVGGTIASSDMLPVAAAAPCPDGSGNTCGPQPTIDPGPTNGNNGGQNTAPNAPQTTIPPNQDTGPASPPTNGNPGFQGTVQAMPTPDNVGPNSCIAGCATQQAPAPTVTPPPSSAGQAPPTSAQPPSSGTDNSQTNPASRKCSFPTEAEWIKIAPGFGRSVGLLLPMAFLEGLDCACADFDKDGLIQTNEKTKQIPKDPKERCFQTRNDMKDVYDSLGGPVAKPVLGSNPTATLSVSYCVGKIPPELSKLGYGATYVRNIVGKITTTDGNIMKVKGTFGPEGAQGEGLDPNIAYSNGENFQAPSIRFVVVGQECLSVQGLNVCSPAGRATYRLHVALTDKGPQFGNWYWSNAG